ncbi:MAG: PQQ-dependent dehydrogenase, methanol/ethanol family [Pseudomonadota bacterium]
MAIALMASIGPAPAQQSDTPNNPFAHDPAAAAAGRALFNSTCAACHGQDATGGRGPALNTGAFNHGSGDYDIFQVIHGGVAGTEMPNFSALPSDDVWRLVTYIKSLSNSSANASAAPAAVASGDAAAGRALFFGAGNCTSCHEINGQGSDFAPDLSAEGQRPVATIRADLAHPERRGRGFRGPVARRVTVTMKDGRKYTGLTRAEDSFSLDLEQADGKFALLNKADIAGQADAGRLTPSNELTPQQTDEIVAFLATQMQRDFAQTSKVTPTPVLPYDRIAKAEPKNWATYWGDYKGFHFSALDQINKQNVRNLAGRWSTPLLGESILEATPIVVDGVMYISGSPGEVYALDAKTGLVLWSFKRKQDVKNPYQINPFNRGVAVLDGRAFFGTLDDNLIALDAHTGRELWEKRLADPMLGYTFTGAPLAIKNKIVIGVATGEAGIRGWVQAFDPANGNSLWRFETVPGPGEKGNETWAGDSWKYGGAAAWLTSSYDPETNSLIMGTGNPVPDYNADLRKGDNLYSDSVISLDADTGKLKWYYQFTPNDPHDWDSTEDMVLADQVIDGKPRKLVLHADRNGFFYALDRTNGKFLFAKPFVRQTWNMGFEANGRPIIDPKSLATAQGQVVFPSIGGTNFQAPSYDAGTKTLYVEYGDSQGFAISAPAVNEPGKEFLGRGTGTPPSGPAPEQGVAAIDTATGNVRWKFPVMLGSLQAGVLATRGGVVFASTSEGQIIALDGTTGKELWHYRTGQRITASPISYSVDGKQFVVVASGNFVFSFALPN